MDKSRHHTKGEHEEAMIKAKNMLNEGCEMIEIINKTQLTEEDILRAKTEM